MKKHFVGSAFWHTRDGLIKHMGMYVKCENRHEAYGLLYEQIQIEHADAISISVGVCEIPAENFNEEKI